MRPSGPWPSAALFLVLSLPFQTASGDEGPGALTPSPCGSVVQAGSILDLSFRFPPGIQPDEWEAYLSLDGGESYPVRLTREQSPASTRLVLRVPNLPTDAARILVRAGGEEGPGDADRFEMDVAVSGVFRIGAGIAPPERAPWPDGGRLPRRGDRVRIEWIVEEGPEPGPEAHLPDGLSGRGAAANALAGSGIDVAVTNAGGKVEPGSSTPERTVRESRPVWPANRATVPRPANPPPLRV